MKEDFGRSFVWTTLAFLLAFLVVILDAVKLIRVFSLHLLRGIPREWTFELNTLLSISYFFHLIGFVYALGLPDKELQLKKKKSKYNEGYIPHSGPGSFDFSFSMAIAIFIFLVLIIHIISTILLIDYSPPNYLLI